MLIKTVVRLWQWRGVLHGLTEFEVALCAGYRSVAWQLKASGGRLAMQQKTQLFGLLQNRKLNLKLSLRATVAAVKKITVMCKKTSFAQIYLATARKTQDRFNWTAAAGRAASQSAQRPDLFIRLIRPTGPVCPTRPKATST